MTREHFDQFKNDALKLTQDADVLWEQFKELKNSNEMVVRLAKKQKCQIDLLAEDRQKTNDEIKIIKLELRRALEKIKELEKEEKEKLKNQVSEVVRPEAEENDDPVEDTFDLELLVNDIDSKLAIKEEEQTFNYLKKMDLDL
jgi:gas vesicle protein